MPCSDHGLVPGDKCSACFAADLLAFTLNTDFTSIDKRLDKQIRLLEKDYNALKSGLEGDDAEYCKTLIFGLNTRLAARKHRLFGTELAVLIDPNTIQNQHRQAYRRRLSQWGTWIGFTEFTVLADIYRVRFWLAVPAGGRWRRWLIGDAQDGIVANPALLWRGNHYEVATLTQYLATDQYTANQIVETNPHGNCGLESFLLMLDAQGAPNPGGNDRHRALRVYQLFHAAAGRPPVNGVISDQDVDYRTAITELRELVANEMTTGQLNDAIIAEGELPGSSGDKSETGSDTTSSDKTSTSTDKTSTSKGKAPTSKDSKVTAWVDYRAAFEDSFSITQTVVQAVSGNLTCVSNIGVAANWLAVVQNLGTYEAWADIKKAGLKSFIQPVNGTLTHTGLMLAKVPTASGLRFFACAAANFHQSLCKTKVPWIFKDSNQTLGKGRDMHTERFALIQLDTWIGAQSIVPNGTIEILWILEKSMCPDECVPVLERFVDAWGARGVKVASDDSLRNDKWFAKNLGNKLKQFDL
jgi:hypothetical protein